VHFCGGVFFSSFIFLSFFLSFSLFTPGFFYCIVFIALCVRFLGLVLGLGLVGVKNGLD
jgi:hypothetical protein